MFLTVHATAGVLIGQQTGNIWLAFLAGFVSHFILDIIPHGDQGLIKNRYKITVDELKFIRLLGIIDTISMVMLMAAIYSIGLVTAPLPVLFAVAGSILPDYINACYIFFKVKWLQWYFEIHYQLHFLLKGLVVNFQIGIIIQAFFLMVLLFGIASTYQDPENSPESKINNQKTNVVAVLDNKKSKTQTITFTTEPIAEIKPHTHASGDNIFDPDHHALATSETMINSIDIWATEFNFNVDNATNKILHHAVVVSRNLKRGNACPNPPFISLMLIGSDSDTSVKLPKPYALFIPKNTDMTMLSMFHNPFPPLGSGETYFNVKPRLEIETQIEETDKLIPAESISLGLNHDGCNFNQITGPIFEVPPNSHDFTFGQVGLAAQEGSKYVFPENGKIIFMGGHIHSWSYGKKIDVYLNDKLAHTFISKKISDSPIAWEMPNFSPDPFIEIAKGDVISITATYDNPTKLPLTDAMAMIIFIFAPDPQ